MTGRPRLSATPWATSLPSEPISRVMAMIGIFPLPACSLLVDDGWLAVDLAECTPFAVARIAGRRAALRHLHRAILELRDLAERVERRVRQDVRRRLVEGERNEDRAARGAGVFPDEEADLAAA